MITREQAAQAVIAARSSHDESLVREISVVSLEPVNLHENAQNPERYDNMGVVWEEQCWLCQYDYRDKRSDGSFAEPHRGWCYIVEPKPGPYVIK